MRSWLLLLLVAAALAGSFPAHAQGKTMDELLIEQCGPKLQQVIQHHPRAAIRHDLDSLITNGIVFLNYQSEIGLNGMNDASVFLLDTNMGEKPVFNFAPTMLLGTAYDDTLRDLVIWHEYQHLRQLLSGRVPKDQFRLQHTDVDTMTVADCHQLFECEAEAYLAEAKLAQEMHARNANAICRAYAAGGIQAMRLKVAEWMAAVPNFQKCSSQFRGWALHPVTLESLRKK